MCLSPLYGVVEVVAGGDRRAGHQQQNQIKHSPRLPIVLKFAKMLQKKGQTGPRPLLVDDRVRLGAPGESVHRGNHRPNVANQSNTAVNLTRASQQF
jgi:hypothetical protein